MRRWNCMASARIWIREDGSLAPWQMPCGSPPSGTSGGLMGDCDHERIPEAIYRTPKAVSRDKGNPDSVRVSIPSRRNWSSRKTNRPRRCWWMCMICWTSRRMPTSCSVKSEIVPIKKHSSGWGTLKDYAENWGNHYALPKPKTPEEKQKRRRRQVQLGLPTFRYHPNTLETGAFEESADGVPATAAARTTHIFYTGPFTLWRMLSICARSVSPAARRPGNMMAASRTIAPGTMAWRTRPSWTSSSTELPATPVGSRNTGAPTVRLLRLPGPCGCQRTAGAGCAGGNAGTIPCGMTNRRK